LSQTWQPGANYCTFTKNTWVAKKDLLGKIPGKLWHMKQVSQVMNMYGDYSQVLINSNRGNTCKTNWYQTAVQP